MSTMSTPYEGVVQSKWVGLIDQEFTLLYLGHSIYLHWGQWRRIDSIHGVFEFAVASP